MDWSRFRLETSARLKLARNVPQEETDGASSNTFNAQKHWIRSAAEVSYAFNWPVGDPDLDAFRIAIISPRNPNPISKRPEADGSGTGDVDVTLKEAVKTSPADAVRPGISTVIWSPEIANVRPGKLLEIKDTPVKAGSVNVRMILRSGPAVIAVSVKVCW
jgi:hypothetical protein